LVDLEEKPSEALGVAELEQVVRAHTEISWYLNLGKPRWSCTLFDEDRMFLHLQRDRMTKLERELFEKLQAGDRDKLESLGWRPSSSSVCESTDDDSGSE